ncbi:hypothetical protein LSCM1_03807 [Leishmania martiniquensis]|uniref:Uncharacterized protein n=1 Tax=Leishmania martiniquensis TaxID=1580590 RepID=A0A836H977_9TRYP|nr:hypothetical protein LSCM1_03807 [Leishmania martiniquensis]
MLAGEGDPVHIAHAYVFGYRPACSATAIHSALPFRSPQPPSTTPPLRARPPRRQAPGNGGSLVLRRPKERRRILVGKLSHRQFLRKGIVPSSRASGTEHPVVAVSQQYYSPSDLSPGPPAPLDAQEYSSPIRSRHGTCLFSKAVTLRMATSFTESVSRIDSYGHHFKNCAPSAMERADAGAAQMPPRGLSRNAAEFSSPSIRAPWPMPMASSPSLHPTLSVGSAMTSMVTAAATAQKGGSVSIFERLSGESSAGLTTLGKRVRQWAEGAGLILHPPRSVWHALLAYSIEPLKHEQLWRRTCAKARHRLSLLARSKVSSATALAAPPRARHVTKQPSHADPYQEGVSRQHQGRARRSSSPSLTPGGLSAYRRQQEYMRWCQWQLWHFFEQGSSYLWSVWRVSPPLGRRRRRALRRASGAESAAVSSALPLLRIFNGRYAVPSAASIDAAQEEHRALERRVNILLRLLLEENGISAVASAAGSRSHGATRSSEATVACGAGDVCGTTVSDPDGEVEADVEANLYHLASESRRRSEAVAATQPFLEVRIDEATGLMHLSLYVNGDAGGNGAEFVGSSVAGCIDNHRWVILKGLWARQVLVFCFHREEALLPSTDTSSDGHLKKVDNYHEPTEQEVSRRSRIVDGLVVRGVAFSKVQTGHTSTTAHDTFVCTRCGHSRRRHNEVYTSKLTGRLARGAYYCVVCLTRTPHVRLPPMEDMPPILSGERATAMTDASGVRALRELSSVRSDAPSARSADTSRPRLLLSAHAPQMSRSKAQSADGPPVSLEAAAAAVREWTCAAASAPRPEWHLCRRVNSDDLFGRRGGLDCPPPRPRFV